MATRALCKTCSRETVAFELPLPECCGVPMTRVPQGAGLVVSERVDTGLQARAVETVADATDRYSAREREQKLPVL